jgi:hypothetical protein
MNDAFPHTMPCTEPEAPHDVQPGALAGPPRRRRLWQLPAELRACVVGLGLPPAVLRRGTEQALARLHRVGVVLRGSDADVLASVLCDLGSRNPVSERVHALLDQCHAGACRRVAALREPAALQGCWREALAQGDEAPGLLWALLTHRQGAVLQDGLLSDLRAWTFAHTRASLVQQARQADADRRLQDARAEAEALRLRLQAAQSAFDAERQALRLQLAQLRGERDAWQASRAEAAPAERQAAGCADREVRSSAVRGPAARPRPAAPGLQPMAPAALPHPRPDTAPRPLLKGQRVLCVGGMPGAQARYRELIETAGARFAFHDGGLEQSVQRLVGQLDAADLVVCQAGCLNHEAYHRVKGHCRRAGKPCLFVHRPSLASFARTLGLDAAPASAAGV